jgi:hypothetical protein
MSYNPFVALQWLLDGRTTAGMQLRTQEEIPSRQEALRLYTSGSAWFDHSEGRRGTLEPGKLADLVLVAGRPWQRIEDVRAVRLVIQAGRVVVDRS